MSQQCTICGKIPQVGMHVSHSHRRTKTRRLPNLQRIRILHEGSPRRVRVCTSCIRAGKIKRVG